MSHAVTPNMTLKFHYDLKLRQRRCHVFSSRNARSPCFLSAERHQNPYSDVCVNFGSSVGTAAWDGRQPSRVQQVFLRTCIYQRPSSGLGKNVVPGERTTAVNTLHAGPPSPSLTTRTKDPRSVFGLIFCRYLLRRRHNIHTSAHRW